jgi:hypothetical protein
VRDKVSHPYKTRGKIIVRGILIFKFLRSNYGKYVWLKAELQFLN